MKLQQVDKLPQGSRSFLTVTAQAQQKIRDLVRISPPGCFRIRADIGSKTTDWTFAWDDQFKDEDFVVDIVDIEIVMDATTIAYILDEYTLDFELDQFSIFKNPLGALRHQQ